MKKKDIVVDAKTQSFEKEYHRRKYRADVKPNSYKSYSHAASSSSRSLYQQHTTESDQAEYGSGYEMIGQFAIDDIFGGSDGEKDFETVNLHMTIDQLKLLDDDEDDENIAMCISTSNEVKATPIKPLPSAGTLVSTPTKSLLAKPPMQPRTPISAVETIHNAPLTPKPSHRSPRKQSLHTSPDQHNQPHKHPAKSAFSNTTITSSLSPLHAINTAATNINNNSNDNNKEYEVDLAFVLTLALDKIKHRHAASHSSSDPDNEDAKPLSRSIPRYTLSGRAPNLTYSACYDDWTSSPVLLDALDPDHDDLSDHLNELFQTLAKVTAESLTAQYEAALHGLWLLHDTLRCPRQHHTRYWQAHTGMGVTGNSGTGTSVVANLLSVLSRLSLLAQSRRVLLCLFRALAGLDTPADHATWRHALSLYAPAPPCAPVPSATTHPLDTTTRSSTVSPGQEQSGEEEETVLQVLDRAATMGAGAGVNSYLYKEQYLGLSPGQIRASAKRTVQHHHLTGNHSKNTGTNYQHRYTGQHDYHYHFSNMVTDTISSKEDTGNTDGILDGMSVPVIPSSNTGSPSGVAGKKVPASEDGNGGNLTGKIDVKSVLARTQMALRQTMRQQVQHMVHTMNTTSNGNGNSTNGNTNGNTTSSSSAGEVAVAMVLKPSQMVSNGNGNGKKWKSRLASCDENHSEDNEEEDEEEDDEDVEEEGSNNINTNNTNNDNDILPPPTNNTNTATTTAIVTTLSSPSSSPVLVIPPPQPSSSLVVVHCLLQLFLASLPWKVDKFIFAGKNLLLLPIPSPLPVSPAPAISPAVSSSKSLSLSLSLSEKKKL